MRNTARPAQPIRNSHSIDVLTPYLDRDLLDVRNEGIEHKRAALTIHSSVDEPRATRDSRARAPVSAATRPTSHVRFGDLLHSMGAVRCTEDSSVGRLAFSTPAETRTPRRPTLL